MFDWKTWLEKALEVLPQVVEDVETIHAGKSTETKTQIAAQSLVAADTIGDELAPTKAADIDAATQIASSLVAIRQAAPITATPAAA